MTLLGRWNWWMPRFARTRRTPAPASTDPERELTGV
jgi:hypothetical protein